MPTRIIEIRRCWNDQIFEFLFSHLRITVAAYQKHYSLKGIIGRLDCVHQIPKGNEDFLTSNLIRGAGEMFHLIDDCLHCERVISNRTQECYRGASFEVQTKLVLLAVIDDLRKWPHRII